MLAAGAAVADPSYSSQITIGGYAGEETLDNFPVLVRIKADQPKGFAYSQCQGENGADISFTDSLGNVIPHEIDTWNPDGDATTNLVDVGSLTEEGSLTANLENLAPDTTYCAMAVATNDKSATDESVVAKFTTKSYLTVDALTDASGIGGDTITVSGTVAAFDAGKTCTLTVLTGDSETTATNEWAGLADSTLSADADSTERKFSFSLCETDTAKARYIAPGSTVYVAVKARSATG